MVNIHVDSLGRSMWNSSLFVCAEIVCGPCSSSSTGTKAIKRAQAPLPMFEIKDVKNPIAHTIWGITTKHIFCKLKLNQFTFLSLCLSFSRDWYWFQLNLFFILWPGQFTVTLSCSEGCSLLRWGLHRCLWNHTRLPFFCLQVSKSSCHTQPLPLAMSHLSFTPGGLVKMKRKKVFGSLFTILVQYILHFLPHSFLVRLACPSQAWLVALLEGHGKSKRGNSLP